MIGKRLFVGVIFVALLPLSDAPFVLGGRSKVAQETAEFVLQRFGRQAAREGSEVLARKIEANVARHGADFITAVRQVGPRAMHLAEEAGVHGGKAVRVIARHGEHGATWVVGRQKGMQLFLQHGDDAAAMLVKHRGVAEPVIDRLGMPAVKALQATNPQNGRRLAMLLESGELTKLARHQELLEVIAKYGDRAMHFVWEHKAALATTVTLTAFLANPETFITGATDITRVVAENTVKPAIEAPAAVATEVARGTNWTLVFLTLGIGAMLAATTFHGGARNWCREKLLHAAQGWGHLRPNTTLGGKLRTLVARLLKP